MNNWNWKLVLGVVLGTGLLLGLMVFGLTRIESGGSQETLASVDELVDGAGWITGGEDYKVTVVEFADLQCPGCAQVDMLVSEELRKMEGVRYVFRQLPLLTIHKNSWKAARAAETAKEMGQGWQMMELLFKKQSEWSDANNFEEIVPLYAEEIGLDKTEFEIKYGEDERENQIVTDHALANRLKIGGTPTFFVEGQQVASQFVLNRVEELLSNKE